MRTPSRFAALIALAALACGGTHRDAAPGVGLSEGAPAQAEFRVLRARFFDADAQGRAALSEELGDFLTRFPDDPRTLDVRVYLVWARLGAGDPSGARRLLDPLLASPAGPRLDFVRVANAAILARSGEAARALGLLTALDGKLVDLDERFVYGEERARAAFAAGAYDEALAALLAWLVQAPLDRQSRARETAALLLGTVRSGELVRALASLKHDAEGETRSDQASARSFLASTIAKKLTALALERSDAELARRLLEAAPAALRASPEGQRLLSLASGQAKAPAVAGRALGLLLSLSGSLERRRAAAVSAGLTRVLASARTGPGGSGVDLLVRYDTDDVDAALSALAADGASLLVAGNDDETARTASARAEALRIPLLLLRPLTRDPSPKGFTFVLGLGDGAVEQELIHTLEAQGRRELARVGPGGVSCEIEPEAPGKPRFPLGGWKKGGVDALLVLGDVDCARDLAGEVKGARGSLLLALGLDSSLAYATLGVPTLATASGGYPANAPSGGWYEALGHDAGLLAARALEALPSAGVAKRADVELFHEKARDALAQVSAELWTSGERGFSGSRVLPRELSVTSGGPTTR